MASGGARAGSGRPPKSPEMMTAKIGEDERTARRLAMPNYEKFPEMPDDMLDGEKAIWDEAMFEYVMFFKATGVMPINALDKKALQNYCMYSNILFNLRAELRKENTAYVTITNKLSSITSDNKKRHSVTDRKVINPIYKEIIKIETRQSTLAAQLSLTPDARARMGLAIAKNKQDSLESLISEIDDE